MTLAIGDLGAEIWEGDERRRFKFLESSNPLNSRTSSLDCLSCRIPYQSLRSLNASPSFKEKALLFSDLWFVAFPSPNSAPTIGVFARGWQGSRAQQIQESARRGYEANASPGTRSEAPGRSSGAGHQQRSKSGNQDSQHMLNEPRGSSKSFQGAAKGGVIKGFVFANTNQHKRTTQT